MGRGEVEGQDLGRREDDNHERVRQGPQLVGQQPVGGGRGVPGQAEGGGGRLQPNHFQALPTTRRSTWWWDAWRNAWRNARRYARRYAWRYARRYAWRNARWNARSRIRKWTHY